MSDLYRTTQGYFHHGPAPVDCPRRWAAGHPRSAATAPPRLDALAPLQQMPAQTGCWMSSCRRRLLPPSHVAADGCPGPAVVGCPRAAGAVDSNAPRCRRLLPDICSTRVKRRCQQSSWHSQKKRSSKAGTTAACRCAVRAVWSAASPFAVRAFDWLRCTRSIIRAYLTNVYFLSFHFIENIKYMTYRRSIFRNFFPALYRYFHAFS